ncbi:hypothetical protein QBC40DRAFT_330562 [Triangularia verruculosa]|uniref:AA1-like domain-containing protein n=1 Tax=Triangularia verruculosa TaxID=2587418 RepID=A0AAN7ATD8_9PEZI|nr:hypothetical protein QBC40DRAFT_330562 [Triangularia verruculosa]
MLTKNLLPAIVLASSATTVAAGPAHVVHRRAVEVISAREEDVPVDSTAAPAPTYTPKPVLSRDGVCWNSILDLQWSISQLEFQSSVVTVPGEESNDAWGYVSFNLSNTATTYTADCTAASNTNADAGFFNGGQEYLCSLSDGAPQGSQVAFHFNKASGAVSIQETILCSEGEISGTFITRGTAEVALTCSEETSENEEYTNHEVNCGPVDASLWPSQIVGLDEY